MNIEQALQKGVKIELGGKEWTIAMDLNMAIALEKELGSSKKVEFFLARMAATVKAAQAGKMIEPSLLDLRLFYWGLLQSYQPELTLADVGRLLTPDTLKEMSDELAALAESSLASENVKKNSARSKRGGRKAKPAKGMMKRTGSGSGPLGTTA